MKRFLVAAALVAASVPVTALAADAGASISVGQPGFYGQIDIGGFPRPQLIFARPILIGQGSMERPPIYLHVFPGHAKHWKKHCREYNACDERVYFVHDTWYDREYVPHYQERRGNRQAGRAGERRVAGRGNDDGEGYGRNR
jgi:hypothetical protein